MLYTADALILRTYKLGEADRIVVFLTRDRGKKRGVAKGARRSRSRFVGALEPLTEVRVAYFEKERRELVGLNYAEPVRSPLALLGLVSGSDTAAPRRSAPDPHALGYVGYFAELLDEWAQEADADERLYRLGTSMLAALVRRAATGRGCVVDASLYETGLAWLKGHYASYATSGVVPERHRTGSHRVVPFEMGKRLFDAATTPNKRFFVVEGGDHNGPQPDEFYEALGEFLDSLPPVPIDADRSA